MANFQLAYDKTNSWEGYYSNQATDPGRETYKGISRRYHPNWIGWKIIDGYKKTKGPIKYNQNLDSYENLGTAHRSYAYLNFWQKIKGNDIQNQDFANLLYDVYWGFPSVIKELQKYLGVVADGVVGSKTIAAINSNTDLNKLYQQIWTWRKNKFASSSTVATHGTGWTNRNNDYALQINGGQGNSTQYASITKEASNTKAILSAAGIVLAVIGIRKLVKNRNI